MRRGRGTAKNGGVFSLLRFPGLTLVAGALTFMLPFQGRADDAMPKRPETWESDAKPPRSVRLPTVLGGLGFTAFFWGAGVASSYAWPDAPALDHLRVPVVGPWQAVANNRCSDREGGCGVVDVLRMGWFVLNGLAQAGGLAVALEGVLLPTQAANDSPPSPSPRGRSNSPERAPSESPQDVPPTTNPPLFFLPVPSFVGKNGLGIGWGGIF